MIVTRLEGIVVHALHTLRQAQRLSRLPSGLAAWPGEEFLRFTFAQLEGEVVRRQLSELVDAEARTEARRDGRRLYCARGPRRRATGFTSTMLKPDAVLRAERHRPLRRRGARCASR